MVHVCDINMFPAEGLVFSHPLFAFETSTLIYVCIYNANFVNILDTCKAYELCLRISPQVQDSKQENILILMSCP